MLWELALPDLRGTAPRASKTSREFVLRVSGALLWNGMRVMETVFGVSHTLVFCMLFGVPHTGKRP